MPLKKQPCPLLTILIPSIEKLSFESSSNTFEDAWVDRTYTELASIRRKVQVSYLWAKYIIDLPTQVCGDLLASL